MLTYHCVAADERQKIFGQDDFLTNADELSFSKLDTNNTKLVGYHCNDTEPSIKWKQAFRIDAATAAAAVDDTHINSSTFSTTQPT